MPWWLDPGKEVLNVIFNRILAPYVENLDMNQVNYGIGQGALTLKNLKLKKGALDKFRLPVDVLEGVLGRFTLSLHWMNLGNQPVEILIEDVYLLVVPTSQENLDPEEEERRKQDAKAERLKNAELLHVNSKVGSEDQSQQSQGLVASLISKVINNLQVKVKNIHIRYEDKLSVPGHPFASGITLSEFSAISVNSEWVPSFIDSSAGSIHKLAKLESLAVYFDTDTTSLVGLEAAKYIEIFSSLISTVDHPINHQFILKPVSGEGRVVVNHKLDKATPRFDVELFFEEIGVVLDDDQYRDVISLVDMYHFYLRQHQYRKYRPSDQRLQHERPKALWEFAMQAIQDSVHQKKRQWTWEFFAERRDDRNKYVDLFNKQALNSASVQDKEELAELERKLSYEDIRFYRSIARSRLRKDLAYRKKVEGERQNQGRNSGGTWMGWLWGSSSDSHSTSSGTEMLLDGNITEQQRKELYEVLNYDEKEALASSFEAPTDSLKARIKAKLHKGTFALKSDPRGKGQDIISVAFNVLEADVLQRSDNLEASVSLGGLGITDGTTPGTLYPEIVHVKESQNGNDVTTNAVVKDNGYPDSSEDPFFFLKYENKPLDSRADNALTVRMRHMEIIYQRGYVEAVYKFFKPPESQLESVEALLNAASVTLDGLRKDTRAGLEYALQTHKTIDLRMDLNAPIIIVPEDVRTKDCRYLVIDCGHISIASELADQRTLREVQLKRNQQYTEEDYKRLESLMYDKLLVKLEDAQFVLGSDLLACREALISANADHLHLLEKISIAFSVQNSIVPTVTNIAKLRISGTLPTLQLNVSDVKYQTLMRLIDVCVPNFNGDQPGSAQSVIPETFSSPRLLFGEIVPEYNVHEGDSELPSNVVMEVEISDAGNIEQHNLELDFRVDALRMLISKSSHEGEKQLGELSLHGLQAVLAVAQFKMNMDLSLESIDMHIERPNQAPLLFISSMLTEDQGNLLKVAYTRVQKDSPDYVEVYNGVDQSIDVRLSTFIFQAAPEPIISLYDFVMNTFVPTDNNSHETERHDSIIATEKMASDLQAPAGNRSSATGNKIRISAQLARVEVILVDGVSRLATLSLSTAEASVLLSADTLLVTARLGGLSLVDNSTVATAMPNFKYLLSIEGEGLADFRYETFDLTERKKHQGFKSSVMLKAGSLKLVFLEEPLHSLYRFGVKFAKLKGLYDAASQAAAQKAAEIDSDLMGFDIHVASPVVTFPSDATSKDGLTLRLGEISARNSYESHVNKTNASLRGIQLTSSMTYSGSSSILNIIDDINISLDVSQSSGLDRKVESEQPALEIAVQVSDVRFYLTQAQYQLLVALTQAVPRVLSAASEGSADAQSSAVSYTAKPFVSPKNLPNQPVLVDQNPELRPTSSDGNHLWTTLDLVVTVPAVKIHLYDHLATTEQNLKDHGIARFALNSATIRSKMLSDSAVEAELTIKSCTMTNTRPGTSKFREIIPLTMHDRNQFMFLYTKSGAPDGSALAIVTIDSPAIIFAIDPLMALIHFFTGPFKREPEDTEGGTESLGDPNAMVTPNTQSQSSTPSGLDFRVDLHNVALTLLESDAESDSRAIKLVVKQVLVSQQAILALNISRLGMALMRMDNIDDKVRFLDDMDLTLSLDSRTSSSQQMTSVEIASQPIVFRASYRDINLINSIVSKALESSGNSVESDSHTTATTTRNSTKIQPPFKTSVPQMTQTSKTRTRVIVSREQLTASFEGFSLVLIGDLHEQPLLHLKTKPFIVGVKDWSAELHATSTIAMGVTYWNLSNSHWEPLIDPWSLTTTIAKSGMSGALDLRVSAQQRLDLNISTAFVELAISTANMLGQLEGERLLKRARGSYAPYRICNRTGSTILIWSDIDGNEAHKDSGVKLVHDNEVDWRFDDWKTMREHVSSSGQNCVGILFVGKAWESVRGISVDREGEYTYSLRPRTQEYSSRFLCEVSLQDNVKVVTLRSTYKVENETLYPVELTVVDDTGHPVYSVEKIGKYTPGRTYSIPIEAVVDNRICLQPDHGFGYKWSSPIRWLDMLTRPYFTVKCPHSDSNEAAFRFQACAQIDMKDPIARKYPKVTLKIRAPIELENLLPFNIQYRIFDKHSNQNWTSFLRSGGIMPVHSVELSHLVLLNVTIQDTVFKPSEFAIINTDAPSDFKVEDTLVLKDANARQLELQLNYIRYPDAGGSFKLQIYSPYIVVNKTGLPFNASPVSSSRTVPSREAAGDTNPDSLRKTMPFMISHPQRKEHGFVFRLGDSAWSTPVSFEAPTADTEIVMMSQTRKTEEEVHVGLSWSEGLGKYKLTKVITLAPRFLLKNKLDQSINFREHGVALGRDQTVLGPGDQFPVHFFCNRGEKLLTIACSGLDAEWSSPFTIEDIGILHIRLPVPTDPLKFHLVRVDVKMGASTIFVVLSKSERWPFTIENESDHTITISQNDRARRESPRPLKGVPEYSVASRSKLSYAWDAPAAKDKRIVLAVNGVSREVDVMEIGNLVPFKFPGERGTSTVSLDVRAEDQSQVLEITNYQEEFSLYKLQRRGTISSTLKPESTSSLHETFEAVTDTVPPTLSAVIDFDGIGVSLINRKLVEVVYLSVKNLKFEYSDSPVSQALDISCGVQIDNQLHDSNYTVLLQPTPVKRESTNAAALPTLQASVIWLKDRSHGVIFVKYLSVLLQALTIQADEDFLFALYDLTKLKGLSWNEDLGTENVLLQNPDSIPEPSDVPPGQDLYFEVLELQPVRLSVSFMRTDRISADEKLNLHNPLVVVLNALTMTIGSINDAPLEFNSLAIKDMRLTSPDLQARILYHYKQEVLRQLYRILGSADFIGNPVGLFTTVSSGIADVFYEPLSGVVMHGNKELGIGIAKGAASFVKKTVFGVTDSLTKISSSVGKGLSAATLDSDYQNRRRINLRRNRPKHAIYGLSAGLSSFATSVASGVGGVVIKPVEGAETEGAIGFVKGVGKGLVGFVTKPVVGAFDLTANVTEGIRNTTTVFDRPNRDRERLPRLRPADGVLKPYDHRHALGQYWLLDLDQGAYRQELYVAHIDLPGGDGVVMLTMMRVLLFWSRKLRLEWDLPFSHISGVTIENSGIRFRHKSGSDQDRFVPIPDKHSQTWFFRHVSSVVKTFNSQRRLDR